MIKRGLQLVLLGIVCVGLASLLQGEEGAGEAGANAAAESAAGEAHGAHDGAHEAHEGHELSRDPVEIGKVFGFPITNSMLVTWIVAVGLIVVSQLATRNLHEVPSGLQNVWEWMVESLYNFLEKLIGHDLVQRTFWLFASIFIFILFANWITLIPGVGTIGWGVSGENQFVVTSPWFRGANADLNLTFAMAIVFFVCWGYWALQTNGPIGFLKHIFAPKGETTGALKVLMIVVFLAVGFIEVVSILFRPISLSFRLYGNIFAGETMLETLATMIPALGWLIPIPFYFLELLVGLVQATVFMLLTAVFTMLICQHEEH